MSEDDLTPYDIGPDCKPDGTPFRNLIPRAQLDDQARERARERWEQIAAEAGVESVIFQADTGAADRLRESLARIYGPEVMREALDTPEAQSYRAAWEEYRAEQERFAAELPGRAQEVADALSGLLPEGMRFEWRSGGK